MPSLATLSGPVWVTRRAIPFSLLILSLSRGGRAAPASPRIQSEALVVSRARASVFMREGQYAQGERAYRDALAVVPGDPGLRAGLGVAILLQGRTVEARELLEAWSRQAPGSVDLRLALARAYLGEGRAGEALSTLDEPGEEEAGRGDVLFQRGMVLVALERYAEAASHFERAGSASPALRDQAELQRGLALARAGHARQARDVFGSLRDGATHPTLAQIAEKLETRLTPPAPVRRDRTRRVVKLALQYDDNAVIVPTTNVFGLQNQESKSWGNLINASISHDLEARPDHAITATYSFLQTLNHEIPVVNLQDHALNVQLNWSRPREKGSRFYGAGVGVDTLLIDERSFLDRVFLAPYHAWADEEGRTTTLQFRYQGKNFRNESALVNGTPEDRDADNYLVGISRSIPWKRRNAVAQLGYQFDQEEARGDNVDYQGHKLLLTLGGAFRETSKLRYNLQAQLHLRDYANIHTLFGVPREDDGTTLFASLAYPIRKSRTLSLEYLRDRNKSNIALFDYVRNVTSLAMTWTF